MTFLSLVRSLAKIAGIDGLPAFSHKDGLMVGRGRSRRPAFFKKFGFVFSLLWFWLVPLGNFERWFYGDRYRVSFSYREYSRCIYFRSKRRYRKFRSLFLKTFPFAEVTCYDVVKKKFYEIREKGKCN